MSLFHFLGSIGWVEPDIQAPQLPRPQALPSFSMLHAEKQEGLVSEVMCVTSKLIKSLMCMQSTTAWWRCTWIAHAQRTHARTCSNIIYHVPAPQWEKFRQENTRWLVPHMKIDEIWDQETWRLATVRSSGLANTRGTTNQWSLPEKMVQDDGSYSFRWWLGLSPIAVSFIE